MITLEKAKEAIVASEKKAQELGIVVSTAIVDEHGTLIAFSKMDNALIISPDFAINKAYTSANLSFPTKDLSQYAIEGKPYYGINTLFCGKFNLLAGGLPVKIHGKHVGGVGVGGSADPEQDAVCAQEALNILSESH